MPSNFEKISYIIENNIKYKLQHKDLYKISKNKCNYFLNNGLINIEMNLDPMYEYYKILCVLKAIKRLDYIGIYFRGKMSEEYFIKNKLKDYIKYIKILIITNKLKLNIIYTDKITDTYFNGIIFNSKNNLMGLIFYFLYKYRKNNKLLFTEIELDIIKEYLNTNNRTYMINYINKYIILKRMPKKLKYLFKNANKDKSYKSNYINHMNIIKKNKEIMNNYYNELINKTLRKYKKYIDSTEFKNFAKKNKHKIKRFNLTKKIIFSDLGFTPNIKQKISHEVDKIK